MSPTSIRRFRKKPVIIEAYQYLNYGLPAPGVCVEGCIPGPHVHTQEGVLNVRRGDWIIRPCAPDVFELTYEPVEEQESNAARRDKLRELTQLSQELGLYTE
jgi:hypothetical protein